MYRGRGSGMNRVMSLLSALRTYVPVGALLPVFLVIVSAGMLAVLIGFPSSFTMEEPGPPPAFTDIRDPGEEVRHHLKLSLQGPGRWKQWQEGESGPNFETTRSFSYMEELSYRSRAKEVGPRVFRENRQIDRFQFLLLSAPPGKTPSMRGDIRGLIEELGSEAGIMEYGKYSVPVPRPRPSELTREQVDQLAEYARGNPEEGRPYRMLSYISPAENQSFSLTTRMSGGHLETVFDSEPDTPLSDVEKDIVRKSPVLPEWHLFQLHGGFPWETPPRKLLLAGGTLEDYVTPFFQVYLEGNITLRRESRDPLIYGGSGEFNLARRPGDDPSGELVVDRAEFRLSLERTAITSAHMEGQILPGQTLEGHLLEQVQFRKIPTFRFSYRVSEGDRQ